jgi:hypothetical protein
MKVRKYTEHQLAEAVKNSTSFAQTLSKLGVAPYGGNYVVLKKAIRHFNLNASHFTGQIWNKGKTIGPKQPLELYLSNQLQIQSYKLKRKLLSRGVLKRKCSNCKGTKWLGSLFLLN